MCKVPLQPDAILRRKKLKKRERIRVFKWGFKLFTHPNLTENKLIAFLGGNFFGSNFKFSRIVASDYG